MQAPENTVIFIMNCAQIWVCAIVLNIGRPFRRPLTTNKVMTGLLIAELGLLLYFIFSPVEYLTGTDNFIHEFAGLVPLPLDFRFQLFGLVAGNLLGMLMLNSAAVHGVHLVRKIGVKQGWVEAGNNSRYVLQKGNSSRSSAGGQKEGSKKGGKAGARSEGAAVVEATAV